MSVSSYLERFQPLLGEFKLSIAAYRKQSSSSKNKSRLTICHLSIVRLGFISVAVQAVVSPAGGKHENGTPPAVWSTVEAAVGVLAACLPPLGPLIRKAPSPRKASATIIGKIVSKTSGRRNSESGLDADRKASSRLTPAPVAHSHIVQLHPAARDAYIELEDRMV